MIDAKDTFYIALRDRLAALNPARTVGLRGVTRPGILVEENELATATATPGVFRLRWTKLVIQDLGGLPLVQQTCEIRYATAGTPGNGGMDRGRLLTRMDTELSAALRTEPYFILKQTFDAPSFGTPPATRRTNIFWSDPTFAAATTDAERVQRTATVELFAYQEAGE